MRQLRRKKGGMISSPAAYAQGKAWSGTMLPGVHGNVSEGGTFFSLNTLGGIDPPMNTSLKGGKKTKRIYKRKRKTRQKKRVGGSRKVTFGPIVNLMRNASFHTNALANQWNGRAPGSSPLPTVQSLYSTSPRLQPPDVMNIHANAGNIVSQI